ncbi:MAG: chemotaxis protein CheW [Elusimicrobia bacterium]|nr:chemotaxis protein CheW [Elusimicrobiota bacterium]
MIQEKKQEGTSQLVVFNLANEEYGVAIGQVQEIIRPQGTTRIPGMPSFIEGVINLRGKIIPIIDLRERFSLVKKESDARTRVVVAEVSSQTVGLVVDSVSEVLRLANEAIDPLPPTITDIDGEYLKGVGKLDRRLIILLDLEKVLTDLEKSTLEKINKTLAEETTSSGGAKKETAAKAE